MSTPPNLHALCAPSVSPSALDRLSGMGMLVALLATISTAADRAAAAVIVADQQLSTLSLYHESTLAPIPGTTFSDASLVLPASIAVGPNNDIYVSGNFSGNVVRFDGQTLASLGVYADVTTAGAGATPGTLRFAPSGDLYVADAANGNIHVFQGPGGAAPGTLVGSALNTPVASQFAMSFAFDPGSTDIIVANDTGAGGEMYRVDSGGVSTQIGSLGVGGLFSASSMLVGPGGELYVVDLFGNQVVRFDDVNGTNPTQWLTFPTPTPVVAGTNFPSDILLTGSGDLLVSVLGQYNLGDPEPVEGALRFYDLGSGALLPGNVEGINPVSAIALLSTASSGAIVPEPSSGFLLLTAAGVLLVRQRRRRLPVQIVA